jgi:apolipoprotein N-acyltransferase
MPRTSARYQWVPRAGLAVLSGLLLAASFPPLDWGAVAWVALVPLFYVLRRATWRAGACYGGLTGLTFFLLLFTYLLAYGFPAWFALSAWESVFLALGGACVALAGRHVTAAGWPIATAALWTLANFLRGNIGPLSLPFGELAYAQHNLGAVIQLAGLFGMYGVTLLVALVNAALANLLVTLAGARAAASAEAPGLSDQAAGSFRAAPWIALALVSALLYGWVRDFQQYAALVGRQGIAVAVVQGDVSAERGSIEDIRSSVSAYLALSEGDAARGAHLIVWPEGSVPGPINALPDVLPQIEAAARDLHAWLLFGAQRREPDANAYNSAILLSPEGTEAGHYDKNNLVMFGEYVPFRRVLGWVERYGAPRLDITPGNGRPLLRTDQARLGCLICFESLFPGASRQVVREGADVLVIITSDGWAGQTAEVRQHAYVAQLRAVETGRYVIRAGDTGLTCLIEPSGRIRASIPPFRPGVLLGRVLPLQQTTPYVRWGDVPLLIICIAGVLVPVWLERRRRLRTSAQPAS